MSRSGKVFLAVDMGASSGRVLAGVLNDDGLRLEEIHRFPNGGVAANGRLYWDVLRQWTNVKDGLRAAAAKMQDVVSVGVDTWGVDFGLLSKNGELLGNPYHYRDHQTRGMMEKAFATVDREEIFAATGLQFMELNTLYQLLAMQQAGSPALDAAQHFLMMPDLFHWLLTGRVSNEFTNASTTQFLDPASRDWAISLLKKLDLPTHLFGPITSPGSSLGPLQASVAQSVGLAGVEVVIPATHDTASAVMAAPAASQPGDAPDWCYISSGTWSLMGVEAPSPVVTPKCRELNFTNEGGVAGSTRLLKNIAGLWLVQECRRIWTQAGHEFGFDELVRRANAKAPLRHFVNPDDPRFVAPADMPQTIVAYCRETGQTLPDDEGAIIRCVLESLAMRYRFVLGCLEELTGQRIETIHILGGGVQNRLLCQMAADACNRRVVAGPIEATAIGNVMMQAVAAGEVGSIAEARQIIRKSFDVEEYTPQDPQLWEDAYPRFLSLLDRE